jgi:hypothetical protein
MLHLNHKRKCKYIKDAKIDMTRRLQGHNRATRDQNESVKKKKQRIRDKWEFYNLGGYEICYPLKSEFLETSEHDLVLHEMYEVLINHSRELWNN